MIKKTSVCAVFSALSIVVSSLEQFIPLQAIIPLPGVKIGLSNCIILFVLIKFGIKYALPVMFIKVLLSSLLFSGMSAFIYSFTGGLLSILVMRLLLRYNKYFSIYGISVAGAAFHNIGQIFAAYFMLGSVYIFKYLFALLIVSLLTGFINAILTDRLLKLMKI